MSGTVDTRRNVRGWTVVFAALGVNLVLGLLYGWGVMGKALVTQWGWTKTEAALPFTVATMAFALMMIFAGRLQDRIGPRVVVTLGGVFLGLGLILSSMARSPLQMLLAFGGIGGIGIGLGYSATTPPSIKWFPPSRKGLITGLVVSGVGMAAVYVSPLTEYLLSQTTISRTFLILGIGAIALVSIMGQFVANPPAGYDPGPRSMPSPNDGERRQTLAPGRDLDWNEMLATPQFYQLWLMFVLAASAGLMLIAHLAIIGREQAGLQWGFLPIATLAAFNTCGRVVSGLVSDRIGRTRTMVLAFALQALNILAFAHYTAPSLLIFGSAFAGLCYGTIFTLMPSATADFYGTKNLGVNYGFVFTAFGVAGVVGPMLGGWIRDLSGSYAASFNISGAMLLVGTGLAFTMKGPRSHVPASDLEPGGSG